MSPWAALSLPAATLSIWEGSAGEQAEAATALRQLQWETYGEGTLPDQLPAWLSDPSLDVGLTDDQQRRRDDFRRGFQLFNAHYYNQFPSMNQTSAQTDALYAEAEAGVSVLAQRLNESLGADWGGTLSVQAGQETGLNGTFDPNGGPEQPIELSYVAAVPIQLPDGSVVSVPKPFTLTGPLAQVHALLNAEGSGDGVSLDDVFERLGQQRWVIEKPQQGETADNGLPMGLWTEADVSRLYQQTTATASQIGDPSPEFQIDPDQRRPGDHGSHQTLTSAPGVPPMGDTPPAFPALEPDDNARISLEVLPDAEQLGTLTAQTSQPLTMRALVVPTSPQGDEAVEETAPTESEIDLGQSPKGCRPPLSAPR